MFKLVTIAAVAAVLTGCGTTGPSDYKIYADAQRQIATAKSAAEIARYQALENIAAKGDTAASVAAAMGIAMGSGGTGQAQASTQLASPTKVSDTMLKWASVLVPSIVQVYGIGKTTDVAITHSNNSVKSQQSNNDMVVDLVQGRAPVIGTQDDVLLFPVTPAAAE